MWLRALKGAPGHLFIYLLPGSILATKKVNLDWVRLQESIRSLKQRSPDEDRAAQDVNLISGCPSAARRRLR